MAHRVYSAIVQAMKERRLSEPLTKNDFESTGAGFKPGTYNAFLHKHRKGNPGGVSDFFELVAPGEFRCLRPYLYGH